jgi:hypothetical protein
MVKKKVEKVKKVSEDCKPTSLRYALLGIVVLAILILPMINVGEGFNQSITGHAVDTEKGIFGGFGGYFMAFFTAEGANLDFVISKYFLLFLVAVFLKSIMSLGDFPPAETKKDGSKSTLYQWLMAIPIAVLAVIFITPADLYGALSAYTALGLALTIFIPFAVVIMYTVGTLTKPESITPQNMILANFMWLLFAGFLVYRVLNLWLAEGAGLSSVVLLISMGAAIIALLITLYFKNFGKWLVGMTKHGKSLQADLERQHKVIEGDSNRIQNAIERIRGMTDISEGAKAHALQDLLGK